jgi:mRNA-degrading endonuclease toxin of MazEF toxin-antitoxin module
VTDNDFNPEKIETISAEELDKKIGQTYSEEVSEINIK